MYEENQESKQEKREQYWRVIDSGYKRMTGRLIVLYRRASTRAAGLVLNTLDDLVGMAVDRA